MQKPVPTNSPTKKKVALIYLKPNKAKIKPRMARTGIKMTLLSLINLVIWPTSTMGQAIIKKLPSVDYTLIVNLLVSLLKSTYSFFQC